MKKILSVVVVLAVVVTVLLFSVNTPHATGSPFAVSHVVHATENDEATLKATFLAYKNKYHEMAVTDKIKWTKVLDTGQVGPLMAYDASDHRTWAIVAFNLVLPASYRAEVSFQDGGNMGIMKRASGARWVMTGSPGVPLCAKDVPSPVAKLWGLKNYLACT